MIPTTMTKTLFMLLSFPYWILPKHYPGDDYCCSIYYARGLTEFQKQNYADAVNQWTWAKGCIDYDWQCRRLVDSMIEVARPFLPADFKMPNAGQNEASYVFYSSREADRIVSEIVDAVGLQKNFVVKAANVANAMATVHEGRRYILYSTSFLDKFKADGDAKWAAYGVLAHEIGHHLNGHDFSETDPRKRKMMELEADIFSGGVLRLLGANLEEAKACLSTITLEGETATHPPLAARREAVASGWKRQDERLGNFGMSVVKTVPPAPASTAELPKIWVVVVGIERYEQAVIPLQYAKNDAYEFSQYLRSADGLALPKDQVRLLTDYQASKDKILIALSEQFDRAGPNDMVIFYYSGHGAPGAFLPQDYTGSELSKLPHREIMEILSRCKAKQKVIIADACFSGSFSGDKDGNDIGKTLAGFYKNLLDSKGGVAILTSSKATEISKEVDGKQQGVFSYYIVQGLSGAADEDGNGIVTIQELFNYVENNTRRDTGYRQTPVLQGKYDPDMPIGMARPK